ncbi:MAG: 3-phosphoglycerate dehydrogenase [Phycisphaerae bacterium]|nr:3-phosphoglycerate dehydrogenase [Phycisphaerae bacterium]|tara:strand:- start:5684 stop:6625 length:942 start_codon:yes stop_codon:yes gene_type:complete
MADLPIIILAEPIEQEARQWLSERVDLRELAFDQDGFDEALACAHGLVVRTATRVDARLLDGAPCLRIVARAGVGLDGIDLDACRERDVEVLNTPSANTQAVVEFVIASVTNELRPRERITNAVDGDQWRRMRASSRASMQMDEMTFGILGFGRIGSRLGAVASAIGFRVLFHDLRAIPDAHRGTCQPVDLDTLLLESDVLSIHVDGRASNHGLVDAACLAKIKDSALLVNASRGFVIDEPALASRLGSTPSFRAVLDVHETEPIPSGSPMLGLENVVLHPHIAARTTTGLLNMSWVVRDMVDRLASRTEVAD